MFVLWFTAVGLAATFDAPLTESVVVGASMTVIEDPTTGTSRVIVQGYYDLTSYEVGAAGLLATPLTQTVAYLSMGATGADWSPTGPRSVAVGASDNDVYDVSTGQVLLTGVGSGYNDTSLVVAGDVDGDGREDVINATDLGLTHITGTQVVPLPVQGLNGAGMLRPIGDVDGDGHADLLVGVWDYGGYQATDGSVALYQGAVGGYQSVPAFNLDVGAAIISAARADVDGDGVQEILLLGGTSSFSFAVGPILSEVVIVVLDDLLAPTPSVTVHTDASMGSLDFLTGFTNVQLQNLGDIDADGRDDLLVAMTSTLGDALVVSPALNYSFDDALDALSFPTANLFSAFEVADVDGDGANDVVGLSLWSGTVAVWLQVPGGLADTSDTGAMNPATGDTAVTDTGPGDTSLSDTGLGDTATGPRETTDPVTQATGDTGLVSSGVVDEDDEDKGCGGCTSARGSGVLSWSQALRRRR